MTPTNRIVIQQALVSAAIGAVLIGVICLLKFVIKAQTTDQPVRELVVRSNIFVSPPALTNIQLAELEWHIRSLPDTVYKANLIVCVAYHTIDCDGELGEVLYRMSTNKSAEIKRFLEISK